MTQANDLNKSPFKKLKLETAKLGPVDIADFQIT